MSMGMGEASDVGDFAVQQSGDLLLTDDNQILLLVGG